MTKNTIGETAGQIWFLLDEKKTLSIRKIGEMTKFREAHIFMAIGWLAREDKIKLRNQQDMVFVDLV